MIWATVISQSCFLLTVCSISIFGCKEYNQSDFSIDYLVISMCRVFSCVVGRGCLVWSVCSLGKTLLAFALLHFVLRPNLPVTPGISWLPTFAFQAPIMKRTSFLGVSSRRSLQDLHTYLLQGLHTTVQFQLLQHYWLGHRLGLLWYWMVCLGNEQRWFCRFWDCIQVLHFRLFCWPWWPLHFF